MISREAIEALAAGDVVLETPASDANLPQRLEHAYSDRPGIPASPFVRPE